MEFFINCTIGFFLKSKYASFFIIVCQKIFEGPFLNRCQNFCLTPIDTCQVHIFDRSVLFFLEKLIFVIAFFFFFLFFTSQHHRFHPHLHTCTLAEKRGMDMDTNGFYGDTFNSGFGTFETAKRGKFYR